MGLDPLALAVLQVGLSALWLYAGYRVGRAITRRRTEREIRSLRAQVALLRAELWMKTGGKRNDD